MIVDLEKFIVSGRFGPVGLGASAEEVTEAFGQADDVEPERGATPMMMLHGGIEFQLYGDELAGISFALPDDYPPDGGTIETTGLWPPERRSQQAVRELLESAGVTWRTDPVLAKVYPDGQEQGWITENQVYLAFFDGTLGRITLTDQ